MGTDKGTTLTITIDLREFSDGFGRDDVAMVIATTATSIRNGRIDFTEGAGFPVTLDGRPVGEVEVS